MKRFTKLISSVFAALLTLSALVTVTNAKQFTDVPSTAPLLDAINYAVDNNFIEPTSNTTFSPNSYMTRGNMVLMLYRHSGETVSSTNTGFTDVPSSSVYARAVVWAVANEITNGTSSTTFEPNTNIKRQDAAVMMYRYAQYMGHRTDYTSTLAGFTDSGRVQSYALPAMQWAVGAGIIGGTSATTLEPRVALKRGAAAAMLQRYGISVETLNFSRDTYGFPHWSSNFPMTWNQQKCYFTEEDWALFNYYGSITGEISTSSWSDLVNYANGQWSGSCFGMCLSVVLDKMGHIDASKRGGNVQSINDLSTTTPELESLINYYQMLFFIRGASRCAPENLGGAIQQLIEDVNTYGPCLTILGFIKDATVTPPVTGGHAVVAYKVQQITSEIFKIWVHDPNRSDTGGYIIAIFSNNILSQCKFTYYTINEDGEIEIKLCDVVTEAHDTPITSIQEFTDFDIDGPYNIGVDLSNTAASSQLSISSVESEGSESPIINESNIMKEMANDTRNTLYISAAQDFTLTNDVGEYLNYNATTMQLTGTMQVYRSASSFKDNVDNSTTLILTLPASTTYNLTSNTSDTDFYLFTKNRFCGANISKATNATLTTDGKLTLVGDNAKLTSVKGISNVLK